MEPATSRIFAKKPKNLEKEIFRGLKKKLAVKLHPRYLKVQKSVIQSNRSFISKQVRYKKTGPSLDQSRLQGRT